MINLRDNQQAIPTIILAIAAVILTGTLVYIITVPVPTDKGLAAKEKNDEKKAILTISRAREDQKAKQAIVDSLTFSGTQQDVETAALQEITKFAQARKLKLDGFRPQRGLDAGALTQYPFLVTVAGPYSSVVGFTQDMEAKGTKLIVNTVQMASSDQTTDTVSANINVAAFLNQPLPSGVQNG